MGILMERVPCGIHKKEDNGDRLLQLVIAGRLDVAKALDDITVLAQS